MQPQQITEFLFIGGISDQKVGRKIKISIINKLNLMLNNNIQHVVSLLRLMLDMQISSYKARMADISSLCSYIRSLPGNNSPRRLTKGII